MVKQKDKTEKSSIVIYRPKGGEVKLEVKLEKETIWLDSHQMSKIFGVNRPAIVKHVNNIYQTGELNKKSTCSILEQVAADGKVRKMNLYNLDTIISVGYRVNSRQATRFRIWATKILKEHLIKGYTINKDRLSGSEDRLKKLQEAINFLQKKSRTKLLKGQEQEIINLLANYSHSLSLLEKYDKNKLEKSSETKSKLVLKYDDCLSVIKSIKKDLLSKNEASDIFGNEVSHKLESIIGNLYQTFSRKELYCNLEEKAAHLLYLIIKDHPFTDGNKRIASFLFVYFLDRNNCLFRKNGERKINDNGLTALALLIAESAPKEKDQMVALITQLIK